MILGLDVHPKGLDGWRGVDWHREGVVAWKEGIRWWAVAVFDDEEDDL